jgi:hypothetical protein
MSPEAANEKIPINSMISWKKLRVGVLNIT